MSNLDLSYWFMLGFVALVTAFKLLPEPAPGQIKYWLGVTFFMISCVLFFGAGIYEGTGQPKVGNQFGIGREYHVVSTTAQNSAIAALIKDDNGAVHYYLLSTMPPPDFTLLVRNGKESLVPVTLSQPTQMNSVP